MVIGEGGRYIDEADATAHVAGYAVMNDVSERDYQLNRSCTWDKGKRYQNGNTATMVYQVPLLISYLSRFMSLQPGDVISTGTPSGVGVGHELPTFLRAGQTISLGVQGLGVQTQRTVPA